LSRILASRFSFAIVVFRFALDAMYRSLQLGFGQTTAGPPGGGPAEDCVTS
jgi:hypothetical protein